MVLKLLLVLVVSTLLVIETLTSTVAQDRVDGAAGSKTDTQPEIPPESVAEKLTGRVVLASDPNQGVAHVKVHGYSMGRWFLLTKSDADGYFKGKPVTKAAVIGTFNDDKTLGCAEYVKIRQREVVLRLKPTRTIRGRLKDEEPKQPAANRKVTANMQFDSTSGLSSSFFEQETMSDDTGLFSISGLIPGMLYSISAGAQDDGKGRVPNYIIGKVNPASAKEIDLGELCISKPYRPPTFEEFVASNYVKKPLEERLKRAVTLAHLGFVRVLLIAVEPDGEAAQQFFKFRYDHLYDTKSSSNDETHRLLYQFIPLALAPGESKEFLTDHGIADPGKDDATLAVIASDDSIVAQTTFSMLTTEGVLDPELLAEFLSAHRHPPLPNARRQLEDALGQADQEGKRTLVQVGSPSCGPCYLLSEYIEGQKEVIAKDYVHLKLDARMPDFSDVYEELTGGEPKGAPWMAILASDGTPLITADSEKGNIGYPSSVVGIDHFERMICTTKQRITDNELADLIKPLRENLDE